ncbi:1-(5-phosphoribosyl)-5-[(5-phosphoribosylamino)methylideneamino]imidazole-4-carboxamide isomerase [Caldanaerobius polysaccharolyticus]|uniref:1-(5-phosphoribosyl)-5-[(5- phosphoribosylamino)methylideneamino]imidazole-4- carboxamide isomerase n=1 Tax=Caldanaerobius polysaccharolyticus TaxID=44256 RepID=UPI00047A1B05|nr:1-(5-phosphoribosyl)-5-[(5-phosphoribosylamino)methylideneamino]imidazole-4-carboxamide isomerase [Caldanaerobius polysaccharolyticus]
MIIFPAIDILGGKCVRLTRGDYASPEVYYDSPEQVSDLWKSKGAQYLHVVDLDGAKQGFPVNKAIVQNIVSKGIKVQVGGGIRRAEYIEEFMDMGVFRVVLGTSALEDRSLLEYAVNRYGDRVAVGIDSKDRQVSIKGWLETTEVRDVDFARTVKEMGVKTVVFTDISKDGTLKGPNFSAIEEIKRIGLDVVASGGISALEDVIKLKEMGIYGAIIGKALYTGDIDLSQALEVTLC